MEIIKATPSDAIKIEPIERAYIECPWTLNQISGALESENYDFLLGVEDGEVIGYVGIEWCLDEGNICNIAVVSEHRRKGYATALLNSLIALAQNKGVKTLFLEVNELNASAIKTYEKLGFSVYNIRKNYYGKQSAICMKKEI